MFCPKCHAEFRSGFDRCNECGLPLEPELPAEEPAEEDPMETVFSTRDTTLWPVVRSLLDARDIPYVMQGEEAMSMLPIGTAGGIFGRQGIDARLLVPASRAAEARALLADTAEAEEEALEDQEDETGGL